jgi:hypothetical protein
MDAVHTRRGFARCLLALLPLGRAFAAEQPRGETLRGKLIVRSGQPPAADTPDHGRVLLDSDDANLKVLHDDRINGFEMEARGHFTAPGRFLIDAQHTRSLLVRDHDGRLKMVTYWCDVCGIRAYTPGPCVCCQKNTDLDLREPDDIR